MTWLDGWRAVWRVVWLLLTYDPEREEVQEMEHNKLYAPSGHTRKSNAGILYKQVGDLFFVCVIPDIGPISYRVFSSQKALYDYVTSYAPQSAA